MTTQEKTRGASRFRAGLPVRLIWKGSEYRCSAHDLSRSGSMLDGAIPAVPIGETVTVAFLSSAGDLDLRLTARVMRQGDGPEEGERKLGLAFDPIDDDRRETLEALLSRVIEGVAPAALAELPPGASPSDIRRALEQVPVPHRVSLASRGIPKQRELLLNDPNPRVLDSLARNPNLVVAEVRGLLRVRILLPGTLEMLARDTRWMQVEELLLALVAHPRTPMPLAERLIAGMRPDQVHRLMELPGLNPAVRMKLGRKFSRGGGPRR